MTEFTMHELELEHTELLPSREALAFANWANVWANNSALAVNAVTANSAAVANAGQAIFVIQS